MAVVEVAAAEEVEPLRVGEEAVARVAVVEVPVHRYHDLKRVSHVREPGVQI